MAYPHKWSPISCRSSAGQGKLAGQRPTFYRCSNQPTCCHIMGHMVLGIGMYDASAVLKQVFKISNIYVVI